MSKNQLNELLKTFKHSALYDRITSGKTAKDFEPIIDELFQQASEYLGEEVKPRILMIGKTGVGKSSVLNSIFGKTVFAVGVTPETHKLDEETWHTTHGEVIVVDAPGFCDPNGTKEITIKYNDGTSKKWPYERGLLEFAKVSANMLIVVLKCDDKALETEVKFMDEIRRLKETDSTMAEIPVLIVVNQIDKMKPMRQPLTDDLNLHCPVQEKEKNIRAYFDWLVGLDAFKEYYKKNKIILFSAGEDPSEAYNAEILKNNIYANMPNALKTIIARSMNLKTAEAERIIKYYAASAGVAMAVNVIPVSDCIPLSALQIAMTLHLGRLYNYEITKQAATTILTPVLSSFGGRLAFQVLLSFFPGIKNVAGSPLAATITYSIGQAVNEIMASGAPLTEENLAKEGYRIRGEASLEA